MESKRYATRVGFAFLVLIAVTVLVEIMVDMLVAGWAPALAAMGGYTWLLSLLPLYAVAMPICLWLLPAPAKSVEVRSMSAAQWLLALIMVIGLSFVGTQLTNVLMQLLSGLTGRVFTDRLQEAVLEADPHWMAFATVIAAPIGEEFLFRRLILDRTRRFGELPALLLSATMFGLFHLNLHQFLYAFLVGLVLGYIYLHTGRLRYCVALHAVFNSIGGVLASALLRALAPMLEMYAAEDVLSMEVLFSYAPALGAMLLLSLLQIGCGLTAVILAIVYRRRLRFAPGEGGRVLWTAPTVVAFFAFTAVLSLVDLLR